MSKYICYTCGFEMQAMKRPKACPICEEISHEKDSYELL